MKRGLRREHAKNREQQERKRRSKVERKGGSVSETCRDKTYKT